MLLHRSPRRWRASDDTANFRQVLECVRDSAAFSLGWKTVRIQTPDATSESGAIAPHAELVAALPHARISRITFPETSVSRKSRPAWR
jgi:hypothetical protein